MTKEMIERKSLGENVGVCSLMTAFAFLALVDHYKPQIEEGYNEAKSFVSHVLSAPIYNPHSK